MAWRVLALALKWHPLTETQLFYYLLPIPKWNERPAIYAVHREDTLQLTSKTKAPQDYISSMVPLFFFLNN